MLNTINGAEVVAILVALERCRPNQDKYMAMNSKCSMQKEKKIEGYFFQQSSREPPEAAAWS